MYIKPRGIMNRNPKRPTSLNILNKSKIKSIKYYYQISKYMFNVYTFNGSPSELLISAGIKYKGKYPRLALTQLQQQGHIRIKGKKIIWVHTESISNMPKVSWRINEKMEKFFHKDYKNPQKNKNGILRIVAGEHIKLHNKKKVLEIKQSIKEIESYKTPETKDYTEKLIEELEDKKKEMRDELRKKDRRYKSKLFQDIEKTSNGTFSKKQKIKNR